MMIMKCMVLEEFRTPLVSRERPLPIPVGDEVVMRVGACGVCRTDLRIWAGTHPAVKRLPHILGHEVAGEVVEVGESGHREIIGKHALVYFYLSCGTCDFCRKGYENLCSDLRGVIGFTEDGGYSEYIKVPASCLFFIPPAIPFVEAAIITDAIATPYRALTSKIRIQPGETLAVIGVGGLGIHALQIARAFGARVIAIDINEKALAVAREMGAEETLHMAKDDPRERILELSGGKGIDAVADFVGKPQTQMLGLDVLKVAGRFVAIGYNPVDPFHVNSQFLVSREIEIYGSRACGRNDLKETIDLVSNGKVKPFVGEAYPLADANVALEKLERGDLVGRLVLVPGKI
jgi:D-arabinose 1-dehydrogenase-like Zn-dependent alcohol dehydrogenase